MFKVQFSLTEQFISHPVLSLRAKPLQPLTGKEKIRYFFDSEVKTRIIALATSAFAAIDCAYHLAGAITKAHANRLEATYHLKQAARFLCMTAAGSVVAFLWPTSLKHLLSGPLSNGKKTPPDWKNTSDVVQRLWANREKPTAFKKLWGVTSLEDRRVFVECFDSEELILKSSEVINTIYKNAQGGKVFSWPGQALSPTFYHATSLQGLEGILRSGKVQVRHEKVFRGAFVSNKPEAQFGRYVLVFNRTIERLSYLEHGFESGQSYWAGFSQHIPVNEKTLNKIMVLDPKNDEVSTVEKTCKQWYGHSVRVEEPDRLLADPVIPEEWPTVSPPPASPTTILQTLQIRAQQADSSLTKEKKKEKKEKNLQMASF